MGRAFPRSSAGAKPANIDMISGPTCDAGNCVLLSGVKHRLRRPMVENHFLNRCIVSELQLFLGVSALRGGRASTSGRDGGGGRDKVGLYADRMIINVLVNTDR